MGGVGGCIFVVGGRQGHKLLFTSSYEIEASSTSALSAGMDLAYPPFTAVTTFPWATNTLTM